MKMKAIVLAAGKGTRLQTEHCDFPKVLRTALGKPLLGYVLEGLRFLPREDIVIVAGYKRAMVEEAFAGYPFAVQEEQLGTGHAVACVDLHLDLKEEGQVAGIVSAVERQGLHVDVCGKYLRFFRADADRMVDDHLIALGEIHPQVFQAILVGAGIIDPPGIDADSLSAAVFPRKVVIGHKKSSYIDIMKDVPSPYLWSG